jgi:integrase
VSWFTPQRGSPRWRFSKVGLDGKRRYYYADPEWPRTEAGRKKATAWMLGVLDSLEGRSVTAGHWTIDNLRLAYMTWVERKAESGELSRHTFDGHRKQLKILCREPLHGRPFGELAVDDLNAAKLQALAEAWKKQGRGATTIRNRLGSLQAMLNWAAQPRGDRAVEKLIPVNPVAGWEMPRAEYQGDRYAPAAEVDAFLAWLGKRAEGLPGKMGRFERLMVQLVRIAAATGCRPGELCALRWRHIHFDQRAIIMPPAEHKTGRKTQKPRLVPLSPEVAALLEGLQADPERHPEFVFTHHAHWRGRKPTADEQRYGVPWNSNALSRRFKELRREAIDAKVIPDVDEGLQRLHLYRLRHTKITNDLQAGARVADVAAKSGNSIAVIESTYLHPQVSHLVDVEDRLRRG